MNCHSNPTSTETRKGESSPLSFALNSVDIISTLLVVVVYLYIFFLSPMSKNKNDIIDTTTENQ